MRTTSTGSWSRAVRVALLALVLVAASPTEEARAAQDLFFEDFEGSQYKVYDGSSPSGVWGIGIDSSGGHSGPHVAETRPGQNYQDWDYGVLFTEEIDLKGTRSPGLIFNLYYDTELGYDGLIVALVLEDGSWMRLTPPLGYPASCDAGSSDEPCWGGQSGGWLRQELDLSAVAGSRVTIAFVFVADATNTAPGAAIDDIQVVRKLCVVQEAGAHCPRTR